MPVNFHNLVKRLSSAKPEEQLAARIILLSMQERAVVPLIDQFYAGVTVGQARSILGILAEIGGWEALNLLRDVYRYEKTPPPLRHTAAQGLHKNAAALSKEEREHIERYLEDSTKER